MQQLKQKFKVPQNVETRVQGSKKCWNKSSRFQKSWNRSSRKSRGKTTGVKKKVGSNIDKTSKNISKTFKNYIKKHQKTSTNIDKTSTKHQKTSAKHRPEPRHKPSVVFLLTFKMSFTLDFAYLKSTLPYSLFTLGILRCHFPWTTLAFVEFWPSIATNPKIKSPQEGITKRAFTCQQARAQMPGSSMDGFEKSLWHPAIASHRISIYHFLLAHVESQPRDKGPQDIPGCCPHCGTCLYSLGSRKTGRVLAVQPGLRNGPAIVLPASGVPEETQIHEDAMSTSMSIDNAYPQPAQKRHWWALEIQQVPSSVSDICRIWSFPQDKSPASMQSSDRRIID